MIQRLLIRCPESLLTDYAITDRDKEIVGGNTYFKLWCDRSNYREEKNFPNGGNKYIRSFGSKTMQLQAYWRVAEIKVVDERAVLYDLVQAIAKNSISADLQTQTPVQVIDFVLPEAADRQNAIVSNTEAYTVRDGLLRDIVPAGGTVSYENTAWIKDGFSFKLEELTLRYQ